MSLPPGRMARAAFLAGAAFVLLLACGGGGGGPAGSDPGTGWPTAANTGIPPGTPALTVISADLHTTAAGQVFDAVELRGRLYVDHPNVVIRRSRLIGDVYYAVYSNPGGTGLTIEDCDITGGVLLGDGFTGRRNHLHAASGGTRDDGWIFAASHVLLEDNLIDGLVGGTGAHLDGIQVMGGDGIVIRHNWIEAVSPPIQGGGVNAALFFQPEFGGEISNIQVEGNMFIEQGGYYPLRLNARGEVAVRRNRWRRGFEGTAPVLTTNTLVTAWEDNAYEDGEVIPAP